MFHKIIFAPIFVIFSIALAIADGVGTVGPSQFPEHGGEALYGVVCGSCHMPNALGAVGAGRYPSLSENNNLISATYIAQTIMYGRNGMPALGGVLDDEQIADIVNYVRSHFGNDFEDQLTPENINRMRIPNYLYNDLNL